MAQVEASQLRDASIVTSRPQVPPGPMLTPSPPEALTSGSQLNRAAIGGPTITGIKRGRYGRPLLTAGSDLDKAIAGAPWPALIDGFIKIWTAFRPNSFRDVTPTKEPANYGSLTSLANFGFRHQLYPVGGAWNSQAGYPGPVPSEKRPMWNNVLPIVWNLRVVNPVAGGSVDSTVQGAYTLQNYKNPTEYTPAGTASLSFK